MSTFALLLIVGFVLGTFGEYVGHRWMHDGKVRRRVHARHHKLEVGQGVLGEFIDYFRGGMPLGILLTTLLAWPAGLPMGAAGFLAGVLLHMAVAAYAHQLQHEKPELVFWMRQPVHHVHHVHNQWDCNFGISTDLWDRLLGTYVDVAWQRRQVPVTLRGLLTVDWGTPPKWNTEARLAWEEARLAEARARREARHHETTPPDAPLAS